VVDLVHGTAKWVITVDEEVVLAADYDTALAQRDAARDIAARLEGELARVREAISAPSMHEDSCCSRGCAGMHSLDWASAANALRMVGLDVGPMPEPRCDESCNCLAREFIDALSTPLDDDAAPDAVIVEGES